jgi:hypothetical protein
MGEKMTAGAPRILLLAIVALACCLLAGCVNLQMKKAMDTERLMSAAGFYMKLADTPAKLKHLASLKPQRKIVTHVKGGQNVYVYADAKFCKCLYAGNQAAFEAFQKLAVDKEMADQVAAAERTADEASLNWHMWGPWW